MSKKGVKIAWSLLITLLACNFNGQYLLWALINGVMLNTYKMEQTHIAKIIVYCISLQRDVKGLMGFHIIIQMLLGIHKKITKIFSWEHRVKVALKSL